MSNKELDDYNRDYAAAEADRTAEGVKQRRAVNIGIIKRLVEAYGPAEVLSCMREACHQIGNNTCPSDEQLQMWKDIELMVESACVKVKARFKK